jgi:hypothetical protein
MYASEVYLIQSSLAYYMLMFHHIGHEMDVRDLKFGDDSFDVAIDKGERL